MRIEDFTVTKSTDGSYPIEKLRKLENSVK